MDDGFVPFTGADEDNFIDVIYDNLTFYPPEIINSVDEPKENCNNKEWPNIPTGQKGYPRVPIDMSTPSSFTNPLDLPKVRCLKNI